MDNDLLPLDEQRVVAAIQKAEQTTTGEIRVCIAERQTPDCLNAARRAFVDLGMERTRERNGVLILIAPKSRSFAVMGDEGIDQHCAPGFWSAIAEELSRQFAAGHASEGLEVAIARIGELLSRHFPRRPDDTNELPDTIAKL